MHCEVEDGYFDSDHRQVSAAISVPCLIAPRVTRSTAYNYRRADFSALRDSLRLLPWHILDTMSLDDAVDQFYTWVNAAIADHVPTVALKSKFPPWFDGQVKSALRDKDVAHRRMRQYSRSEDREAFRRLRTRFNTRTGGGGGKKCPPLRFFADSGKTAARSAAIFSVPAHN